MSETTTVRDLRAHLAEVIDHAEAGESTIISRNGTPVAAVVPMDAFNALEQAEDELLAREAKKVLEEEGDGPTHTMAEVIADIFGETGAA